LIKTLLKLVDLEPYLIKMGKDYDLEYFETALKDIVKKVYKLTPEIKSSHRKGFTETCEEFHKGLEKKMGVELKIQEVQQGGEGDLNELAADLEKYEGRQEKNMKKCVKAAGKVFEKLDMAENESLETAILKGSIILQATPTGLAEFVEQDSKKNAKLMKSLFKNPQLMKDMLTNGGAKGGLYGKAMQIYSDCTEDLPEKDDAMSKIYKKIALAVALELVVPITEFDTKVEVDPIARYKHYAEAFKNGELDPAFPHFSVWELRHVINCDAPNEQLKWGRDMLMNYAPYISMITDVKWKYLYILKTDVLTRNPTWTSSPRTYQQVLSGGGKEGPNAWFGRFILNAFGIPTWGVQQPEGVPVALTRWTEEGWEAMLGADWTKCYWDDTWGTDFKAEVEARAAFTEEEYYKKLVLLQLFAELSESRHGAVPEEEKTIINPVRLWRSLAIIQKAIMIVPSEKEKYLREGESPVKTINEKYLEAFEIETDPEEVRMKKGKIICPPDAHGYTDGSILVMNHVNGGKQINLLADCKVEYEMPDDIEEKEYSLTLEVCTVHMKQSPLQISIDGGDPIDVTIPYTIGEWKTLDAIKLNLSPACAVRFERPRPSFGVAIKKIEFE
jgi:hypothetical protein